MSVAKAKAKSGKKKPKGYKRVGVSEEGLGARDWWGLEMVVEGDGR